MFSKPKELVVLLDDKKNNKDEIEHRNIMMDINTENSVNPLKWDLLYTLHYGFIALTAMVFGGTWDFKYSRQILFMAYLHFAFETCLSWHFIYKQKTAKILSIITFITCSTQSILCIFASVDIMMILFSVQFVMSDVLSFLSSLSVILNKADLYTQYKSTESGYDGKTFRYSACAVAIHFTGVSLKLYMLPTELFITATVPQTGLYWLCILLFLGVQVYISKPVILGHCNYLGEIHYDAKKQKYLKIFAQIINPLLSLIVIPSVIYIVVQYRTIEFDEDLALLFAYDEGTFDDIILHLAWPYGFLILLYLIYLYKIENESVSSKSPKSN